MRTLPPRNQRDMELLVYCQQFHPQVSIERLVSGPGLATIYRFLRDTGKQDEPAWLAELMQQGDPSPSITRCVLERRSPLCTQALDLFISLYGAEASNTALKLMTTGGVYLGGGIAPRIIDMLQGPGFMEAFTAKGRLRPLLEGIPVRVVTNSKTALYGAARYAALHYGSRRNYSRAHS